jgi:hypothetical protein
MSTVFLRVSDFFWLAIRIGQRVLAISKHHILVYAATIELFHFLADAGYDFGFDDANGESPKSTDVF